MSNPSQTVSANSSLVVIPAPITLNADYVLGPQDDQRVFTVTVPVTITIPPIYSNVSCTFVFGNTGSVTIHPLTGVTVGGVTADQVKNQSTDPAGFVLSSIIGFTTSYVVTASSATFANIGGAYTDNAALAAAIAAKANIAVPASFKLLANHTLVAADHNGLFYTTASSSRSVIIPQGLPTYFRFFVAVLSGGTSDVTVGVNAGVTRISVNNAYRMTQVAAIGEVRCTGDQDTFMFMPNPYWVV